MSEAPASAASLLDVNCSLRCSVSEPGMGLNYRWAQLQPGLQAALALCLGTAASLVRDWRHGLDSACSVVWMSVMNGWMQFGGTGWHAMWFCTEREEQR